MRKRTIAVLFFVAAAVLLRADYLSPFADARVGSTVTSRGQIVVVESKGGATDTFVRFGTDTGPRTIPAEIPARLMGEGVVGHEAMIRATIREREDARTKARTRYLEVLEIQVLK